MRLLCSLVSGERISTTLSDADSIAALLPHSVHQTSDWYGEYIEATKPGNHPFLLDVRDLDSGRLLGLLPLQVHRMRGTRFWSLRRLVPLANGPSDFFTIMSMPSYIKPVSTTLAQWFADNPQKWEFLQLDNIPARSMAWSSFVDALKGEGFDVVVDSDRRFYKIDTSQDWQAYSKAMHKKLADMRNRHNRLLKHGYQIEFRNVTSDIDRYLDALFDCYEIRREIKNQNYATSSPEMKWFVRKVVRRLEKKQNVILSMLVETSGRQVMAYQLDWLHQGVRYHWKPTFNMKFEQYSPSKILLFKTIEDCFHDPNIKEFNFMRGESSYKTQFTEDFEQFVSVRVVNHNSVRIQGQRYASNLTRFRDHYLKPFSNEK